MKFGGKGILVFAGVVALILFIRGWKHRELFMTGLRLMEETIFGKPLDKNRWEKGELKQIKIKPKWRKKKNVKEGEHTELHKGQQGTDKKDDKHLQQAVS